MAASERKTTVYIPDKLVHLNILGNLALIGEKENRSLNAIICRALVEYVEKHGKPKKPTKVKAPKKSVEHTHTPKLPKPPTERVTSTSSQGKV